MIKQFQEDLSRPLLQRRAAAMKEDPMEEIQDLYNQIKDHERNFKRVLDITRKSALFYDSIEFMINKNKEFYEENDSMSSELDRMS